MIATVTSTEPIEATLTMQIKVVKLLMFFQKIRREYSNRENFDHDYKLRGEWQLYVNAERRTMDLLDRIQSGQTFGMCDSFLQRVEYQGMLDRKEKRKQQFLTLHRYSPWFMQLSLLSDYGNFKCTKCENTFHHSPSTIYQGLQTVYGCCCGHCTNAIIKQDHNETPYT